MRGCSVCGPSAIPCAAPPGRIIRSSGGRLSTVTGMANGAYEDDVAILAARQP